MQKELKDLLKPPFVRDSRAIKDSDGHYIAKFQYWAAFSKLDDFMVAALNEKWERDFGEPLRWIYKPYNGVTMENYFECPKCKTWRMKISNFCPHCGVKLDPPEEAAL